LSELNFHLLNECSNKDKYKACPRCKEPILKQDYDNHAAEKFCIPFKNQSIANRCPLCHTDITPGGKIGWEKHYLNDTCPNNPRTNI